MKSVTVEYLQRRAREDGCTSNPFAYLRTPPRGPLLLEEANTNCRDEVSVFDLEALEAGYQVLTELGDEVPFSVMDLVPAIRTLLTIGLTPEAIVLEALRLQDRWEGPRSAILGRFPGELHSWATQLEESHSRALDAMLDAEVHDREGR